MSDVASLLAATEAAKVAYKANKADKSLKVAYKAAKAAHAAAVVAAAAAPKKAKKSKKSKRKAEAAVEEAPAKKAKTDDIASLTAAAAAAKAAYKANKADASLKAAYKAAKAALAAGPTAAVEEAPAADDSFAALKAKKDEAAAAPPANATDKCFVGNLSWDIDDDSAKDFFKDCGEIVDIHWLTDRDSGKFKGCGFLTFDSVEAAVKAVAKTGEMCMGRDIKVDFATPRPDNGKGKGKKSFRKSELSERPDNCVTVFCGNLSFDIDDDAMHEFAKDCGTISKIRWLTDRDSGDFKGCGFVEFESTDGVDAFVKKNGTDLLGRSIRLDYAKPRAPRENSW